MTTITTNILWNLLKVAERNTLRSATVASVSRKPVKILTNEDIEKRHRVASDNYYPVLSENQVKQKNNPEQTPLSTSQSNPRLPSGFPTFEKVGTDDTALSRFVLDSSCPKKRSQSKLIMLEGKRLIADALKAGFLPKAVFFSDVLDVVELPLPASKYVFQKVTYKRIKRWSKLDTPPGIIGFFKIPTNANLNSVSTFPLQIICDNVRDPGNLGSILRVAACVGCKRVLLTKGCTDVWDTKVLRAASGSHFRLHINSGLTWKDIQSSLNSATKIYVADNNNTISRSVDATAPELVDTCGPFEMQNLPIVPYYNLGIDEVKDFALLVGGETLGISEEALKLKEFYKVLRLNVPMENGMDSLNVGSAAAILAYEIKRQFIRTNQNKESCEI